MYKVRVGKSRISGKGVFAKAGIKKGETVGIVEGPIVPNNEESCIKYGVDYLHPISHSKLIVNKSASRFTNHSCEPNCGLKGRLGTRLVAMRDIKKGEELTVDYDTLEYDWKMRCHCGSPNCRRRTKGYKHLSSKLKSKYKGFIAPYLLRRPSA